MADKFGLLFQAVPAQLPALSVSISSFQLYLKFSLVVRCARYLFLILLIDK